METRICVDGRKRRFLNTMTSWLHIGSRLALRHSYDSEEADLFKYGGKVSVFENTRLSVDGRIRFENAIRVDAILFLNTEKKNPFSKILGYILTGPKYTPITNKYV